MLSNAAIVTNLEAAGVNEADARASAKARFEVGTQGQQD